MPRLEPSENGHAPAVVLPGDKKNRLANARTMPGMPGMPGCGRTYTPVAETVAFLRRYIVLDNVVLVVLATWVVAAWMYDTFDRFAHVGITSPEKRCGKTRLLQLLSLLCPSPYYSTNISPAAIYRLIEQRHPTILLDEAQSLARRGSESSEVIRELLNAGIDRDAKVLRIGGESRDEVQEFSVFSPKVIALIGELDGVLADRCLPVRMARKTDEDTCESYRSRVVSEIARPIAERLKQWAEQNAEAVGKVYDTLPPFPIQNDRMAELLLPLQAVLAVIGDPKLYSILEKYATSLDGAEREAERMSPGVRLLTALREIFGDKGFRSTAEIIAALVARSEEPWGRWNRGGPITPEALANLLRPYGIEPRRQAKTLLGKQVFTRGYFRSSFDEAWRRYTPS